MTLGSMILGTGHYVPEKVLTNADLEKIVDTSNQWIVERTGIHERHIRGAEQNNSDLCVPAAQQAIEEAGLAPTDLDLIILGTVSGDMRFPATSVFIQSKLGAPQAAAMDISAACSGFVYGLTLADSLIKAGQYRHILVIGAEVLSLITDWTDRNTCVLFGDGAGAAVVGPTDGERGILGTYMGADGRLAELLCSPGGGTMAPPSIDTLNNGDFFIRMAGREVFLHAVKAMSDSALAALKNAGISSSEVDLLIPHQANIRIMDATAKRLGIPREKVYINIDRFGNTSAASIPIALNEARKTGVLKPGMTCLMVVFGGGFTWASAVVRI